MKRLIALLIAGHAIAGFAQNAEFLQKGKEFGESIKPTTKGQIVNPSAVDPNAWSNGTSATTVPEGMGGFSQPLSGNSMLTTAKTSGLTGLGNSALDRCETYTPTGDPAKDQECAAVNFLNVRCMQPTNQQSQVMAKMGTTNVSSAACQGTYGQGQQQFDFSNQISAKDAAFDLITKATKNPDETAGNTCSTQSVVTEPATLETSECTKAQSVTEEACSQYVNLTVTTTQTAAISTNYCPEGTLVGAFCQSPTTGAADPVYTCAAGQTLVGTMCSQTTTATATPTYSCPTGSTLTGSNCISVNNVSTPATVASYSCAVGYTLSGSTCTKTTTTAATVASYSCPAGQTLQGSSCVATSTTTSSASQSITCPPGTTQSGNNCINSSSSAATPSYTCSSGTLSINSCIVTESQSRPVSYICPTTFPYSYSRAGYTCGLYQSTQTLSDCNNLASQGWDAKYLLLARSTGCAVNQKQVYLSCPVGTTPSGSNCITTTTSSATISSYSCPSGGSLSGSTCTTTTSTSATVSYSCPSGQTLSGSNCTQTITSTSSATPSYSCPSGSTLSGTTCAQSTSASATPSYSCPTGSTLSGSNCVTANNVSTPASVASYSCAAGYTLSGSTCSKTSSTSASLSYSCPTGSTLNGTSCVKVVTTPAQINYSCLDGSAPVNGACIYKSAKSEWINACGPLETAAGTLLGAP